jgi:hypothetical protein
LDELRLGQTRRYTLPLLALRHFDCQSGCILPESAGLAQTQRGCGLADGSGSLETRNQLESTVNYVVSKRFVKKQQMRWTQRGTHLLLQTRVQVLNGDLRKTFGRWFPGMSDDDQPPLKKAA